MYVANVSPPVADVFSEQLENLWPVRLQIRQRGEGVDRDVSLDSGES